MLLVDVDLLRQRVKVRMEDSPETLSWFANADIAVLRSGKAKKNDPPIPADLAPISGSGKRVRREKEEEEEKLFLDPIKFRYSTEAVVEETVKDQPETAEAQENQEGKSRRNRSRRKSDQSEKKEEAPAPKPEKEKKERREKENKEPQEPAEQAETAEGEAKKPHRRRPNYRRYRKPKQGAEG